MRLNRHLPAAGLAVATLFTLVLGAPTAAYAGNGNGSAIHYGPVSYSMDFTGEVAAGYTGPVNLGTWTCSGVRVTNNHFARDNFSCTTTATGVTASFSQTAPWPCGCSGWSSDYDGLPSANYEIDISGGTVNGWAIYS